jgi:hypothetical protein
MEMGPITTFKRVGYKEVLTVHMCHLKTDTEPMAKLCFYMRNGGQWTESMIIALNVVHEYFYMLL